jgi:hypothetical protein
MFNFFGTGSCSNYRKAEDSCLPFGSSSKYPTTDPKTVGLAAGGSAIGAAALIGVVFLTRKRKLKSLGMNADEFELSDAQHV